MRILILHGPNLNLLGEREPHLYGRESLAALNERLVERARELGVRIAETFQSNSEGELVDRVQRARGQADGIVLNAGAYTHTSIALRDALLAASVPFVEVHLSNVFAREPFRRRSYLSDIAVGIVSGFGPDSYLFGLEGIVHWVRNRQAQAPSSG
ncbi:MAG: type II 3-dehydroquinate dehydratase [bacterium]